MKKNIFILLVFSMFLVISCKTIVPNDENSETVDIEKKVNLERTSFSIVYKNCENALNDNPTLFTKGNSIELNPAIYRYNSDPKNFVGWFTSNSYIGKEVTVIDDELINNNPSFNESGVIELYAMWQDVF